MDSGEIASILEDVKVGKARGKRTIESLVGQTWNVFKARMPCLGKRNMVSSMPGVKTLKLPVFQVDA